MMYETLHVCNVMTFQTLAMHFVTSQKNSIPGSRRSQTSSFLGRRWSLEPPHSCPWTSCDSRPRVSSHDSWNRSSRPQVAHSRSECWSENQTHHVNQIKCCFVNDRHREFEIRGIHMKICLDTSFTKSIVVAYNLSLVNHSWCMVVINSNHHEGGNLVSTTYILGKALEI